MYILIDDDKIIRYGWEHRASKTGHSILTFESVEDFIISKDLVPFDSEIYIDSDLKQIFKGEVQAKKIFELGYNSIYLTSGYNDLSINDFPWIKGIISKTPPF